MITPAINQYLFYSISKAEKSQIEKFVERDEYATENSVFPGRFNKNRGFMIKHVEGFKKVSVNATNRSVSCFRALVKDVLQGREMLAEPGLSVYILPDGTIFEFYGMGSHFPDYLFSHSEVVNSYGVPDLESALEQLEKQGAKLLGQVVHMSASCGYCHISLEGGSVIGLFQYNENMV